MRISGTVIKLVCIAVIYSRTKSKVDGYPFYVKDWSVLLKPELVESKPSADTTYPVLRPPSQNNSPAQSKVVFPVPEDVVNNRRNYLPDLGFVTDLAFLFFLPRGLPASGLIRLTRDLFESEECVQYASCEMTKVARRHQSLDWVNNFLQDFPFQGDVADRLRQGSMDAITKINKREMIIAGNGTGNANRKNDKRRQQDEEICTFSCHPIGSLTKGLRILSLLNDLVRTVK